MSDKALYLHDNKQNICFNLAFFATLLTFVVVILGAYTRLTDAGLGCPDWPGCYGQFTVPTKTDMLTSNNSIIDVKKAWTEMIHRYVAGLLGVIIFALAVLSTYKRNQNISLARNNQPIILPLILVVLVVFQALLGMWTVTLKLFPLVVMAHLLGGMTTLALLWWLTLDFKSTQSHFTLNTNKLGTGNMNELRIWALGGLVILIIQISLGGWTSANYAALVCLDFPFCQGQIIPQLNFSEAFNFTAAGVTGSIGKPLDLTARVTIQMVHRFGAIISALVIGWLAFLSFTRVNNSAIKILSIIIITLLLLQIILGITNVLALLPLPVAVLHNAVAALLLLALITLNYHFRFIGKDFVKL